MRWLFNLICLVWLLVNDVLVSLNTKCTELASRIIKVVAIR
jgi:hypothetical protein